MKNVTSHTGILEIVKRMDNSVNGNPRFMLRCDGWTFCTQPDSGIAYEIENHVGKMVTVHIGTHYGRCQLKSLWKHDDVLEKHERLHRMVAADHGYKTQIVKDIAEKNGWDFYYVQTGE